jgi:type VI secretion system secreted protein VgrG
MPVTKTRLTLATTALGDEVLRLHGFWGHEALSEPFRFSVTLVTQNKKPIVQSALLGTVVKVTLDQESTADSTLVHPKRYFNGYVTQVSRENLPSGEWLYRVELRPWLWLLDKTTNCRVFQDLTVPEIVEKVFRERGFLDFKLRLGKYEKREYCVQYRESELQFVSRLLEHEGIYYYFEFDADKHTLVLTDGTTPHEPKPTYETIECGPTYIERPTLETLGGRIYDWRPRQELRAQNYFLKDYDFKKPTANLGAKQDGKRLIKQGTFEKFDYPGGFNQVPVGNRYATVRLQEEQATCELVEGKATSHGLTPGYVFTLTKNGDAAQNAKYLTIRAEYGIAGPAYAATGELQPEDFTCTFTALESSTQFRPARSTPRPVIPGLQTAKVVGEAKEEVHTDVYGRVKVQFHWDREDRPGEQRSCWIRVAQMWAGPSWGAQHIPRIGHEVVVSFLEGDPDQPLITGSVYNHLNKPPFELPAEKEVSGVKSKSTLNGGKGYNELSFNDATGKELVHFHAQRDLRGVVEKKRYTRIGGDDTEVVEGTQNIRVDTQYVTVKKTYALRSLVATELACGPTLIKLTPAGIVITAAKIDVLAPVFQVFSAGASILPTLNTALLPLPKPLVPPTPPIAPIAPPALDTTGLPDKVDKGLPPPPGKPFASKESPF